MVKQSNLHLKWIFTPLLLMGGMFPSMDPIQAQPSRAGIPQQLKKVAVSFRVERAFINDDGRLQYEPVVGKRVEFGVDLKDASPVYVNSPVLETAISNSQGLVTANLAIAQNFERERNAVAWARLDEPGLVQSVEVYNLNAPVEGIVSTLLCRSGYTIVGKVLSADGHAVSGARIRCSRKNEVKQSGRLVRWTDPNGLFAFDVDGTSPITLFALSEAHGVGQSELVDPAVGPVSDPIQIVLNEGFSLRGRILDSNGEHLRGLTARAVPAEGWEPPQDENPFPNARLGALFGSEAEVKGDGSFEIPALAPGPYEIYGDWKLRGSSGDSMVSSMAGPILLGACELGEGTAFQELALDVKRVEVTVTNARGENLTLESDSAGNGLMEWDEDPVLGISTPEISGTAWNTMFRTPTLIDGDTAVFLVGEQVLDALYPLFEGESYVYWSSQESPFVQASVSFQPNRLCARVNLQLHDPELASTVKFHVLDPYGEVFEDTRIVVRSVETGLVAHDSVLANMFFSENLLGAWSKGKSLSPGEYEVTAVPYAEKRSTWNTLHSRRPFAEGSIRLTVEPSTPTDVYVHLLPAGYLNFESVKHGEHPSLETIRKYQERDQYGDGGFGPEPGELDNDCWVQLIASDGSVFDCDEFSFPHANNRGWRSTLPGWDAVCMEAIPPGDWLLRVSAESGVLFQQEVSIVAGLETVVQW